MISFCLAAKPASNSNEVWLPVPQLAIAAPPFTFAAFSAVLPRSQPAVISLSSAGPQCCTGTCRGSVHPSPSHSEQLALGCKAGEGWGEGGWDESAALREQQHTAMLRFSAGLRRGGGTHGISLRELGWVPA